MAKEPVSFNQNDQINENKIRSLIKIGDDRISKMFHLNNLIDNK